MKPVIIVSGATRHSLNFISMALTMDLVATCVVMLSDRDDRDIFDEALLASLATSHFDLTVTQTPDFTTADLLVVFNQSNENDVPVTEKMPIFRRLINRVIEGGFNGKLLLAADQDELLTYFAWKFSGLSRSQILGVGTYGMSHLLAVQLESRLKVGHGDVHTYVVGTSQQPVPVWSRTSVGPAPVLMYLANPDNSFSSEDIDAANALVNADELPHNELIRMSAVFELIAALLSDTGMIGTVTNVMTEPTEQALSTPVLISRGGVKQLTDLTLADGEQQQYNDAVARFARNVQEIQAGGLVDD